MAPIIVARSLSADSTEASKDLLMAKNEGVIGFDDTPNPGFEIDCDDRNEGGIQLSGSLEVEREEGEVREEKTVENTSFASCTSPWLHEQSSNLFIDEHETRVRNDSEQIQTAKSNAPLYSLSNVMSESRPFNLSTITTTYEGNGDDEASPRREMPSPSELVTKLPSISIPSNMKRFGLFSPTSSGELQDVDFNSPHGPKGQIDADEELARQLQAEEDKKQKYKSKPRPAPSIFGLEPTPWEVKSQYTTTTRGGGSTSECWFPDSWTRFGRHISSAASAFFNDTTRGTTQSNKPTRQNVV